MARSALRLRSGLRRAPVDLVHAHNIRASLVAGLAIATFRSRIPLICTVHGLKADDYARAARVLNRVADLVVAVSDEVAERLLEAALEPQRLRVVENTAQPVESMPRVQARRELEIDDDRPVALCLARLVEQKRHDRLLDAWAELSQTWPDGAPGGAPLLLLAGDGPLRGMVEQRAGADGLEGRVRVLGDRRDVGRLLAASDLLVLASDWEGMPMTVLEALSAGVPVVAPSVGGLASLDPGCVELVAPGSAQDLARGVGEVLSDPVRRRAMALCAAELAASRFSPDTMSSAYEILYMELLESRDQ